jgi:hypothetical protein
MSTDKKDICFVIMPYGGYFDTYYTEVFKPAIEAADLTPRLAKDIFRPGSIIGDIWDLTKRSKVILAELTGKNANVFYELGLAHAITKPTVLVTESVDYIPFDLAGLRAIIYDKNEPDWGNKLKSDITKAITETIESPERAIPPAFFDVKNVHKKEISEVDKKIFQLELDMHALRRELLSPHLAISRSASLQALINNTSAHPPLLDLPTAANIERIVRAKTSIFDAKFAVENAYPELSSEEITMYLVRAFTVIKNESGATAGTP